MFLCMLNSYHSVELSLYLADCSLLPVSRKEAQMDVPHLKTQLDCSRPLDHCSETRVFHSQLLKDLENITRLTLKFRCMGFCPYQHGNKNIELTPRCCNFQPIYRTFTAFLPKTKDLGVNHRVLHGCSSLVIKHICIF